MKLVSIALEDYIRAIYIIENKEKKIRSRKIAEYLKVTKSSVSEMLLKLKKIGMINYEKYSKISLTKRGRELAERLTFKHRVIEMFLFDKLNIDKNLVHMEAHKLEHALSDDIVKRLYNFIGKPRTDPHGKSIV